MEAVFNDLKEKRAEKLLAKWGVEKSRINYLKGEVENLKDIVY